MFNSIILSSCVFGSIYIFSVSLGLINMQIQKNKKISYKLMFMNSLTCLISCSIYVCCLYASYNNFYQ